MCEFRSNELNRDKLTVTPCFLKSILTDESFNSMLTNFGVRIVHARFIEPIDFRDISISHLLILKYCEFEESVNLAWVKTTMYLSFKDSYFHKEAVLYLRRIRFARFLDLSDATFQRVFMRIRMKELLWNIFQYRKKIFPV